MINGGICSYPHGSQLDEAVAYLESHRQFVAFITIDIGANDFPCQAAECVPAGVNAIQTNLPMILAALREAAGPNIPIIGMTIYNPFLANWLLGPEGQAVAQFSATHLMGPVNAVLTGIFQAGGADVADIEAAFSSNDFATQVELPGFGTVPLNVARICMWTWVCTAGRTTTPTRPATARSPMRSRSSSDSRPALSSRVSRHPWAGLAPRWIWGSASMRGRPPGRTVLASTADQRSRRSQMDAMTQLLLALAVLFVLKIAAIQLR